MSKPIHTPGPVNAIAERSDIVRAFKCRLLPTRKQHRALADILESQRLLYNGALEHRISAYRKARKNITLSIQEKELTELRREEAFSSVPVALQRWTLRRIDAAFLDFFRRVKAKDRAAGFPRFRGKGRWQTFGLAEWCGIHITDNRLRIKGISGTIRVHLHRSLPPQKPIGCTFHHDDRGWHVSLQYRLRPVPLPSTGREVGIDMGLNSLCVLSTGESIPNLRVARRAGPELRRKQRALSRCKRASNRREKIKRAVTRCHSRMKSARRTYLHQVSARLIRQNDRIFVEDLKVKRLAASRAAKPVHDAGWGLLRQFLTYKAESAGRELIAVDPNYTSQTCPDCGQVAKKTLKRRTHMCDCGCVLDRDHAAAKVILARGRSGSLATQRKAVA